jgi:L-ascorbate metabolism protein UlaG (beta-lactamase superfamily)
VPIDGAYTMGVPLMMDVIRQIQPQIVLPMHYWGRSQVERFLGLAADSFDAQWPDSRTIDVAKATLPEKPTVIVIGGSGGD